MGCAADEEATPEEGEVKVKAPAGAGGGGGGACEPEPKLAKLAECTVFSKMETSPKSWENWHAKFAEFLTRAPSNL